MEDEAEPTCNEIQVSNMSEAQTKNVADVRKARNRGSNVSTARNKGCGGANMASKQGGSVHEQDLISRMQKRQAKLRTEGYTPDMNVEQGTMKL